MAKNDNLKDFLTDVADAIREKKDSTDLINPQNFSSEIKSIQSGGDIFGFDKIGYTLENNPIKEWVEYSQARANEFNATEEKSAFFENDHKIHLIPILDYTNTLNVSKLFSGTIFVGYIPDLYMPNVISANRLFTNDKSLIEIGEIYIPNAKNIDGMFTYCSALVKVKRIYVDSVEQATIGYATNELSYIEVRNIGASPSATSITFTLPKWGDGSIDGSRQSLVDSLIKYSYDRASAGYTPMTISLYASIKSRLTEEEIAQITAKGFTIA